MRYFYAIWIFNWKSLEIFASDLSDKEFAERLEATEPTWETFRSGADNSIFSYTLANDKEIDAWSFLVCPTLFLTKKEARVHGDRWILNNQKEHRRIQIRLHSSCKRIRHKK